MADKQNQFADQTSRLLHRLTTQQKFLIGGVTVVAAIALIILVTFVNRPTFGLLYSNLAEEDASKIVTKLKEQSIPYQLDDGGKSILVPRQQLYELRLSLATDGLPRSSTIGYEIFDRTNLGVSDFVQKINYRRALEGELARTILEIDEVEGVRVHIVTPEKALFKDDERPATASVILKLKSAKPLRNETTQAITHLVASSVEALDPANVTIVDSRGNLLSDNAKSNSLASLSATQYELQQKVENFLAKKAQTLLDEALGTGNSMVQVNAELDFRQVEQNLEQYDPDNTAVRSEQTSEEKTVVQDSVAPSTRSSSVTNYEVNKTVQHIIENVGNIKKLSVAAIINEQQKVTEKNGEKSVEFTPLPQDEMDRLTEVVRKAVGFSVQRNDEVSVVNLPFNTNTDDGLLLKNEPATDWYDLGEKGLILLAMAGAVLIVRSLLNRFRTPFDLGGTVLGDPAIAHLGSGGSHERQDIYIPAAEEEISKEALVRAERRNRIAEYISTKPEDASRLLKVWLKADA